MKAWVYERYGSPEVLELRELPKPVPGGHEVLVRVRAASVNAADWRTMRADPVLVRLFNGLWRPKKITVLGADIAGTVEAIGPKVREFKPGDAVFGDVFASHMGGFAEYKCAREDELVAKPVNVSFEEAAAVPLAALAALHGVRDVARVQAGQKVLIHGASGGVGSYALQLAKHFGAEVTALCSGRNVERARALGADHVIDYTKEDFVSGGARFDAIVAVNGSRSIFHYRRALLPRGRYAMIGGGVSQLFQALLLGPWLSRGGAQRFIPVSSKPNRADLLFLKGLFEAGHLKPVIDCRYPFTEVPDAIRYVEQGHARGKVIIAISN